MSVFKLSTIILLFVTILNSCVSSKKYTTLLHTKSAIQEENDSLRRSLGNLLHEKINTLEQLDNTRNEKDELSKQKDSIQYSLNNCIKKAALLQIAHDSLLQDKAALINASSARNQQLSSDLLQKQADIEAKQRELENKELSNVALTNELRLRLNRVKELERLIAAKDSSANALRKKISDALSGFAKDELTIERKNGKVYVSMAEQLLFKPGSAAVDAKGKEAIKKLAEVLVKNEDIHITIEGHTDNADFKHENYPKDNWDLSVLRATTIVKLMQDNKVNAKRITAAGCGEYQPKTSNETKAGRSNNRRTEIILTPNLDEMERMLNGN